MLRAHKIRLYPNNRQESFLLEHCGCARKAYNVCLAKWDEDYLNSVKHNYYSIKKWFNGVKFDAYPYMYGVSKWAVEAAINDLDRAFKNFYRKNAEHPRFHKKGIRDSFRIDGSVIKINGCYLSLPKGLTLKMAEMLRYRDTKKIYNVTISHQAGMWFASIQCEVLGGENQAVGEVGIDLGVTDQAILSDGTVYGNIRVEQKYRRRIAHAQRDLHRKRKGSANRKKAQRKLAKVYYRMQCLRNDNIHKFTTEVTRKYGTVCLEDLNVSGMVKNHKMARSIEDVAFFEIRRQFEYKAKEVRYINRFAPSTKACSICGYINKTMTLVIREWVCPSCGTHHDRDKNAAQNILRWATPEVNACG
jgi:putative transposase